MSRVFLTFLFLRNGERGIWTLAPLLTTYSLSRGAPSASWVFLQDCLYKAERVGFEPTRPCGQTVFKTASLWPLRYLSILPYLQTFSVRSANNDYSIRSDSPCQQIIYIFCNFLFRPENVFLLRAQTRFILKTLLQFSDLPALLF